MHAAYQLLPNTGELRLRYDSVVGHCLACTRSGFSVQCQNESKTETDTQYSINTDITISVLS